LKTQKGCGTESPDGYTPRPACVVVDGEEYGPYKGVGGLTVSPSGNHVAFAAQKGETWSVMMHGTGYAAPRSPWAVAEYDALADLTFTPDGERLAYGARKAQRWSVVINGEAEWKYAAVAGLLFSPDGRRVAYAARTGERWSAVVDGTAGPEYTGIAGLIFSPDSKHVAYTANKSVVVVDGKAEESGRYDGIAERSLTFTPDGKHIAYAAQRGKMWLVVVDGEEVAEYEGIGDGSLIYSPDGKHMAYAAQKGETWSVVVDGKAGAEYQQIEGGLTFSPDSKRVAYVAAKGPSSWEVVVDGQPGDEYEGIVKGSPVFSNDSKHAAYAAHEGMKFLVVVDGKAVAEYDGIARGSLRFGSDGVLRCFALREGVLYRAEYVPKPHDLRPDERTSSSAGNRRMDDSLSLVMSINQRTLRAIHFSEGRTVGGMEGEGATLLQGFKEYGYTSESVLFAGDEMLLNKAMVFTRDCARRGFFKSNGDQLSGSAEIAQPEAAVAFLKETFTPAERVAIQYEITSAKPPVVDEKRAALLRAAGYNGAQQIRLRSHADW
jgi:hypothetical protein